jgi:putative transcriptional regulator
MTEKEVEKQLPVMQNRIKQLRQEIGLSQEELANRVEVRRETIVHLESNRYNPSLKLASDIAHIFKLPIEEVIWFEY